VYRNSYFNGNREPESNSCGELPDDLRRQLSHFNGYRRDHLQLVTSHGPFIHYGRFCYGESCNDNHLYDHRNNDRLYRNGDFNGDGESCSDDYSGK
jgi:hypothetical protein